MADVGKTDLLAVTYKAIYRGVDGTASDGDLGGQVARAIDALAERVT